MTSSLPSRQVYSLCERCSARQGGGGGFLEVPAVDCFICKGTMDRVDKMAAAAQREAGRYQFRTFSVGVSMPPGLQEREDEVRSDLKLKGDEGVKVQAARLVAEQVAAGLRKRVDKMRPDLTLLVDFDGGTAKASTRPVYYYGRYTKPPGLPQRRELCANCSGRGCERCRGSGFEPGPSVESELRRKLSSLSRSDRMTFTWLGSEDVQSRVCPPGRPFLVEVKSPMKRAYPRRFAARFKGGQVIVSSGRLLAAKPLKLPTFKFRTKIVGTTRAVVSPGALKELRARFRNASVRFERPNDRPTDKMVYRVAATTRGRRILIDAELDGGLPVKRFVSGDLVSPSVSEVLKTEVRCRTFDICGVKETGAFELAEVSRVKEKN